MLQALIAKTNKTKEKNKKPQKIIQINYGMGYGPVLSIFDNDKINFTNDRVS